MYHCIVNEKSSIKQLAALLSLSGLVLLLLFSPCNVRKHLQTSFGMPQTEVSNKNKAVVSNSNCSSQELTDAEHIILESTDYSITGVAVAIDYETINSQLIAHTANTPYSSRERDLSIVPYYILYQNFQGYL